MDEQPKPRKKRRERGDDGIYWDKINKCYLGTISLGYDAAGKRIRRRVRGKTKAELKAKLDELHDEIKADIRTSATYTVQECVSDWLDELTLDPDTVAEYRGQAEKWIYTKIGTIKLKDFTVADAERFFRQIAKLLGKRSLMMIKSTLRRSIRHAQKHDLIGKNVAELVDLPEGQPGRPSRAMTEEQARKVLQAAASDTKNEYVKVIRIGEAKSAATHAATTDNQVACRNKPRKNAPINRGKHRPAGRDLPNVPRLPRPRRHHRRPPTARSAVRRSHHARPTPRRATSPHLGPCQPRPRRDPYLALNQTRRRHQDAEVQALCSVLPARRAIQALIAHQKRQAEERLAAL